MSGFARYEAYKNSGVEWLGEIPSDWNTKRFKFVAHTKKGKLPKKIVSDDIGLPPYLSMDYLRGSSAEQFIADKDAHLVEIGETLLLWDGSNAGEFLQAKYGVVSSTVAHIIFCESINKKYAWYYSKFLEIKLRQTTIGMGIPHVSSDELNNLIFCEPSIIEQNKIVIFLDQKTTEIDEAIAKKQRLIELLKEQKVILINQAVTKGLNPNVPMRDSGVEWIGEIPAHWKITRIGFISELLQTGPFGSQLHQDEYVENEIPVLNPSQLIGGKIIPDNKTTVTERTAQRLARHRVEIGDIVFGRRGEMGRCGLVTDKEKGHC
jgi:type I restriction enzyme S subunit